MDNTFTLITGASEGIGRAFAQVAAEKGRNVILAARSKEKLDSLAEVLTARHGVEAVAIEADLSKPNGASKLWRSATAKGRKIDFLVNNAGFGRSGRFDSDGWEREAASIQVNVVALTEMMKLAIPHMKEFERARVLNVASVAGYCAGPNMAVYYATKAYVISLSRAVQKELEMSDITVTAVCPGATQSNFFADADMLNTRVTRMARMPSSREVAEAGWAAAIRGDTVYVHGAMNKLGVFMSRFLPATVVDTVSGKLLERV